MHLQEIVVTPKFLSAEPITSNVIAVTTQGNVDLSAIQVALNGNVGHQALFLFFDASLMSFQIACGREKDDYVQSC